MSTIIPFLSEGVTQQSDNCSVTRMIREELSHLSSNEYMINCILERMQPFIMTLDFNLGLDIEITNENQEGVMAVIPAIQSMQARFDDIISDIISERILHEIHIFHIERPRKL